MSCHSPKEIERIKCIAAKMTVENPAQGSLDAPPDKTPKGMRLNRIETIDGKPVRCFIEDK